MKAISIRQPYVWAILFAGKDVENRSRNSLHRGPLLLHSSIGLGAGEHESAVRAIGDMRTDKHPAIAGRPLPVPPRPRPNTAGRPEQVVDATSLPLGGLCGIVRVVDCKFLEDLDDGRDHVGWQLVDSYGLKLAEARPLPFIPLTGSRVVPFDVEPGLSEHELGAVPEMRRRIGLYRAAWRELGGA